jgi:hypothetical protein
MGWFFGFFSFFGEKLGVGLGGGGFILYFCELERFLMLAFL